MKLTWKVGEGFENIAVFTQKTHWDWDVSLSCTSSSVWLLTKQTQLIPPLADVNRNVVWDAVTEKPHSAFSDYVNLHSWFARKQHLSLIPKIFCSWVRGNLCDFITGPFFAVIWMTVWIQIYESLVYNAKPLILVFSFCCFCLFFPKTKGFDKIVPVEECYSFKWAQKSTVFFLLFTLLIKRNKSRIFILLS